MIKKILVACTLAFGALFLQAPAASANPTTQLVAFVGTAPTSSYVQYYGPRRRYVPRGYYGRRYVAPPRYYGRRYAPPRAYGRRYVAPRSPYGYGRPAPRREYRRY